MGYNRVATRVLSGFLGLRMGCDGFAGLFGIEGLNCRVYSSSKYTLMELSAITGGFCPSKLCIIMHVSTLFFSVSGPGSALITVNTPKESWQSVGRVL